MWQALIGPIANLAGTFLKNKAAEKQAVHDSKMRKINADADWEIISINASPVIGEQPIHPETLCANYFGEDGGTETNMSPEEFTEALRASREWWSDKAMCL